MQKQFLYIKHLVATSGLANAVTQLKIWAEMPASLRHRELGLLHKEDAMMRTCMRKFVSADSNWIDIGAHIGSKTYQLKKLAPQGKGFSVEASPQKADWLRRRFSDVTLLHVAASDEKGEVTFFENATRPGFSSLSNENKDDEILEVRVDAARLDALIGEDTKIDFIKIDVEGHEYRALRGADRILRQNKPTILFEAGPYEPERETELSDQLFSLLTEEYGYKVYPVYHTYFDREEISLEQFRSCRQYPYLAFNFFARHSD